MGRLALLADGGTPAEENAQIAAITRQLGQMLPAAPAGQTQPSRASPAAVTRMEPVASFAPLQPAVSMTALAKEAAPDRGGLPSVPARPPLTETIRISTAKLDRLLLDAEEMLTVKQTSAHRAAELRQFEALFEEWAKQWAKVQPQVRQLRNAAENPDLLDFLELNFACFKSLEGKLRALGKSATQDRHAIGWRVDDLLADAKKLIMLPCSTLLDLFPKLVRDLCRDQGKEADLVVRGGEVEIGQAASESSFKRMLARAGLTEPRPRRRPAAASGQLRSARRGQRPNEVWTVDFKGWWYDPARQRCEPLTVRDEHSRYLLELRRLPDARTETVRLCFERLFERYGLPEAIRSDNGAPFAHPRALFGLSRLSVWWVALGIDLERGRPGHPQDNGGHERMHRDIASELEPRTAEQAALDLWREEFNQERPHEALGMKCPAEVYQRSPRAYPGTPKDIAYHGMHRRRVDKHGKVDWQGAEIFLSGSLKGWSVGLHPLAEGKIEVWFGRLMLGWLDRPTESFQGAASRPLEAGQAESQLVT